MSLLGSIKSFKQTLSLQGSMTYFSCLTLDINILPHCLMWELHMCGRDNKTSPWKQMKWKEVMISRTENKALKLEVFVSVHFIHKRKNQYLICRVDSHTIWKRASCFVGMIICTEIYFSVDRSSFITAGKKNLVSCKILVNTIALLLSFIHSILTDSCYWNLMLLKIFLDFLTSLVQH